MALQFRRFARLLTFSACALAQPACSSNLRASPTSPSPAAAHPPAAPAPAPIPTPAPTPSPTPTRFAAQTYSTTTVSFSSDAEHSVGRGRSVTLTPHEATFEVQMSPNQGELWVEARVKNSTPLSFWTFKVMTPNFGATRITPGAYETAANPLLPASFFMFGGDGYGCSSTARLVIHAFELAAGTATLRTFRASFEEHHCNGASPSMRGEIAILDPWK